MYTAELQNMVVTAIRFGAMFSGPNTHISVCWIICHSDKPTRAVRKAPKFAALVPVVLSL